jgi:uncharacterized DUF497 family protein
MIEWDEAKRRANLAKHGIDLADALRFQTDTALVVEDDRYDYGEVRYQALGLIDGILHFLVYTPRGNVRRVISLRRANRKEIEAYGKSTR